MSSPTAAPSSWSGSDAVCAVVTGADYDELWPKVVADSPWYGEYEKRTTRTIPLVRLRETGPYTG